MNDVLITGVGACTPFAQNASQLWDHVLGPDPTEQRGRDWGLTPRSNVEEIGACPQVFRYVETAAREALQDAGLWEVGQIGGLDLTRLGCTVSASKPILSDSGVIAPDAVNDWVSETFSVQGERRNVIAACATGAYAVALGASWIEQGLCDVVLAGSAEPHAHPLIQAGFRRMGVLSEEAAMRPFDRQRSGFVMSEGAGVVVLEAREHAQRRGSKRHARLKGWGWGADSHSAVAFNSGGERIASVIRQALRRAGVAPEAVQHVNAHGTATRLNDWIETQALIKAFGTHASRLMISATKSSTGHLLGAAGSIELILTLQALREQYIPPTAHLEHADPECALDYTARRGHAAPIEHALSLSFGFGGPIGALLVSHE